jgi:hypothetical protein
MARARRRASGKSPAHSGGGRRRRRAAGGGGKGPDWPAHPRGKPMETRWLPGTQRGPIGSRWREKHPLVDLPRARAACTQSIPRTTPWLAGKASIGQPTDDTSPINSSNDTTASRERPRLANRQRTCPRSIPRTVPMAGNSNRSTLLPDKPRENLTEPPHWPTAVVDLSPINSAKGVHQQRGGWTTRNKVYVQNKVF